jgi:hypothetical protein
MTTDELIIRDWGVCPLCHNDLTGAIKILGGVTTLTGHLQTHEAQATNAVILAVDQVLQDKDPELALGNLKADREAHKKVQYEQGRWEGWVETNIRKRTS